MLLLLLPLPLPLLLPLQLPLQLPLPLLVDGMHSERERPRLSPLQHPPRKVACSVVCLSLLPPLRRLSLRSLQWNQSPQLAR